MAHDVFISHSSKDKAVADATCAWLEARGIRCWVAPRDIRPGSSWGSAIVNAIRGARVMVLIFSDHANASPQIVREVERAVNFDVTIIPVRIEDVPPKGDMEYFLGVPHWLDAFQPPMETHLEGLVAVVNEILAHPAGAAKAALTEEQFAEPLLEARGVQPEAVQGSKEPYIPPPPPRKRGVAVLVVGALFILTALGALGWYFGIEQPAEREKLRQAQIAQQEAIDKEKQFEAQQAAEAQQKAQIAAQAKATADEAARLKAVADEKAAADAKVAADADAAEKAKEEKAKEEAERLANARGGLILKTDPEGATVTLGGVDAQTTPATFKDEKLGTYPVHISLDGYEPVDQTVEIKENQFIDLGTITLVRKPAPAAVAGGSALPSPANAKPASDAAKAPSVPSPPPTETAAAPAPASTRVRMYAVGNFPGGHIYTIPELQALGSHDFSDAWFYGDFILKSKSGNVWTFRTFSVGGGILAGASAQGTTVVEVEWPTDFSPTMRVGQVLSIGRSSPLELISLQRSSNGSLVVRARNRFQP